MTTLVAFVASHLMRIRLSYPLSPARAKILAQEFSKNFPNFFNHNSPADWARELWKASKDRFKKIGSVGFDGVWEMIY